MVEKSSSTPSLLHPSPVPRRLLAGGLLAGFSVVAGAGVAAAAPATVDAGVRAVVGASAGTVAPVSPAALPVTWAGEGASGSGTRFVTVTL